MRSSGAAVHDALIAYLRAAPAVAALVGSRVYDRVPQGVTFPYVALGLSRTDRFRVQGADGCSLFCEINAWTRATSGGKHDAETLRAALEDALDDAALTVSGHKFQGCWVEGGTVDRMGDGLTVRVSINLRIDTLVPI